MLSEKNLKEYEDLLRQFIEEKGWNALEKLLTAELGFKLVETQRTYRLPDGSQIIITEYPPQEKGPRLAHLGGHSYGWVEE
jgi:hypothetical protein